MHKIEDRQAITITNHGEKIFGILHFPLNVDGPVPALIICPGFAGNKCGKFRIFVDVAQELAKNGVAVFRFDYRGAGDSEGNFSDITIESQFSDTLSCIEFLKSDSRFDSNRIGLLGRSLGGMIAILSAAQAPDIRSIALWAPVFSSEPWKKIWESLPRDSNNVSKPAALKLLPANIPAVPSIQFLKQFFQVDLNKELEQIKHIPLLHIHGSKDEFVKYEQALDYQKACESNLQAVFIQLSNSGHDFANEEDRKIAIKETVKWFIKNLKSD